MFFEFLTCIFVSPDHSDRFCILLTPFCRPISNLARESLPLDDTITQLGGGGPRKPSPREFKPTLNDTTTSPESNTSELSPSVLISKQESEEETDEVSLNASMRSLLRQML